MIRPPSPNRVGTTTRVCLGCGTTFTTGVYVNKYGYEFAQSQCCPCRRVGEHLEPRRPDFGKFSITVHGAEVHVVSATGGRVLIDAVRSLGWWDTATFDGRRLGEFRHGDLPDSVYRAIEEYLRGLAVSASAGGAT